MSIMNEDLRKLADDSFSHDSMSTLPTLQASFGLMDAKIYGEELFTKLSKLKDRPDLVIMFFRVMARVTNVNRAVKGLQL